MIKYLLEKEFKQLLRNPMLPRMLLVFPCYAAQNGFRLLLIRFRDANFLKPAFQRRIFFNGLVIFLRCRRANQPNFSARQCRLEQIGGINRPFRRPCTDQRVHLINKGNDVFGCAQLPHDIFEPYFVPEIRLAISRETSRACRSSSGTLPSAIACASASATAVFPTPGSPSSTGLFFVRRCKMVMRRNSSFSLPITGSNRPARASSVRSVAYRSNVAVAAGRADARLACSSCVRDMPVCRSSAGISARMCSRTRCAMHPRKRTSAHSKCRSSACPPPAA